MKGSMKNAEKSRIALNYQFTRESIAHEKTRNKPEDAAPLAQKPTFRSWLADFASRALARFLRFFGFSKPKTAKQQAIAKQRRKKQTPPRAFGSGGNLRKLSKRLDPKAVAKAMEK